MHALPIPAASLEAPAQAEKSPGDAQTAEEEARANNDAVFEFACRFIVTRSLPGWIEEICTEHLQSAARTKGSGSIQAATGAHNADTSVWKKT